MYLPARRCVRGNEASERCCVGQWACCLAWGLILLLGASDLEVGRLLRARRRGLVKKTLLCPLGYKALSPDTGSSVHCSNCRLSC